MKFNKLLPELTVKDFEKSINFYTKLGFKIEYSRGDKEGEHKFSFISMQGTQILIDEITVDEESSNYHVGTLEFPLGRGVNFQITVENIEEILKRLGKYPLKMKPKNNWYRQGNKLLGCKEFMIQDPDGYLLRFSQNIGEKEAQ